MNGLSPSAPWLAAGLLVLAALLMLRRPLGRLLHLVWRSSVALAILAVLQRLGGLLGVSLGVNLLNALVLGALGVPGFALLLILQWTLQR